MNNTQILTQKFEDVSVTTIIKPNHTGVKENKSITVIQAELFSFVDQSWDVAIHLPSPFWFSDLVKKCPIRPLNENMWGAVARRLIGSHFFRRTGNYRRSPTESRKGGVEWEYERTK
jgi:hypothetical protein